MRIIQSALIIVSFACVSLVRAQNTTPPLAERTADGFAVPQPRHDFEFPRDHGRHPEFRIEWWYITGHLFADDGRRFGFQATFFRRSISPATSETSAPAFGTSEVHLAHMSLLDVASGKFIHEERLNRNGWDASTTVDRLEVANGNWSLAMPDTTRENMQLAGSVRGDAVFTLALAPEKPRVVFGRDGVSRKGADATAASYYLTFPRLDARGTLRLAGREITVHGRAWMDHEISSSQLGAGQVGWDWCSVQLDDGWDLMSYRLRRADGSSDPFSTLAWVSPDGKITALDASEFSWEPVEFWRSPTTGGRYPTRYRLHALSPVDRHPLVLEIRALAPNQELTGTLGGIAYWEGACDVFDASGRIIGRAYTELTGYAESLQGKL